ncbi:hypothetical protein BDY21DRAFT_333437 [Lineolata rhizophorae]|uniref:Secreted protein n=1 Tax=Lineolata rhizophorae TaxID=578093 RepID=A0A6A6PAG3_9PEZI|nr:hypothetical protein BDY21DRAFT_333437 [Lineolata rhizophorae]
MVWFLRALLLPSMPDALWHFGPRSLPAVVVLSSGRPKGEAGSGVKGRLATYHGGRKMPSRLEWVWFFFPLKLKLKLRLKLDPSTPAPLS